MNLSFIRFKNEEYEKLYSFLISDEWPFHGSSPRDINLGSVRRSVEKGHYNSDETQTFWIYNEEQIIGMIRLFDLEDETPLFDLRIHSGFRGKGVGEKALNWLTEYAFKNFDHVCRMAGNTRNDNIPMRKLFKKCAYLKEGHIRKGWPAPGLKPEEYYDAIEYGILREDWLTGNTTPVNWDDLGY